MSLLRKSENWQQESLKNSTMNSIDEGIDSETIIESLCDAKFRQNFELMRLSGEMCDVSIVVEDTSVQAHKLILAGCSPYFRCMFGGKKKFTEADQDSISIDPKGDLGIKATAVAKLIDYMYKGSLDLNESNNIELIWAADLLQLSDIKEQCLDRLEQCIDFDVRFFITYYFSYHDQLQRYIV